MSRPRVFFYVQHLQGVGHLYRASRISRALTDAGLEVDLVSGGVPVPGLDAGGASLHQLEPVKCPDGDFKTLRDESGAPIDEVFRDRRRDALLSLFRERRPQAVVIEAFPFGRRQMRFELLPLLEAASAASPRPRVVCSVRDILQETTKPKRVRETVDVVNRHFDAVWVHGDPGFATFEETFPAAGDIDDKIHYTGFVAGSAGGEAPPGGTDGGEILVSAGGGATQSETLLHTALAARPLSRLGDRPWRLLAGPNLPDGEFDRIKAAAPKGVIVEPNRDDFSALLRGCAISVSQAGYNTVVELLQAGCRSLVVPYAAGGETEQSFRAARLHHHRLAEWVDEAVLSPESLARAIDKTFRTHPSKVTDFNLNGAGKSAELLSSWLAG